MASSHYASINNGGSLTQHHKSSSSSSANNTTFNKPFWEFNITEINNWIRQLSPGVSNTGGMLFPKVETSIQQPPAAAAAAAAAVVPGAVPPPQPVIVSNSNTPEFKAQVLVGNTLLQNLIRALNSASSHNNNTNGGPPNPKRPKIENDNNKGKGDAYQILDPSFAKSGGVASSELSTGAILSRMTLGGLVNGMAGVENGVVDTITCIPLKCVGNENMDERTKKNDTIKYMEEAIGTAAGLKLKDVVRMARGVHRSVAAR